MSARKLYFDRRSEPHQSLVKNEVVGGAASVPIFVYGDSAPLNVYLTDSQLGGFDSDSGAAGVSLKLGLVTPGAKPTGGTYLLQYDAGTKTAEIAFNASAATIESALDAISGVSVAVTGTFPCYTIEWDAAGTQDDITASADVDDNSLTPDGAISLAKLVDGDGSTKEKLFLEIRRAPHTLQTSWTQITDGWSGEFSLKTPALCDLLGTADEVATTLEAEITDASGNVYTVGQIPCVLRAQGIDTGSPILETPESYYTASEADNLFNKKVQNAADMASASTSRDNLGISAANTPFTPTTGGDWADPDPTDAGGALDDLAERIQDITGADVGFTPETDSQWDDPDPITVTEALDDLSDKIDAQDAASVANETEEVHVAITSAGVSHINFTSGKAIHNAILSVSTTSGAYTHDVILKRPADTDETSPVIHLHIDLPASSDPTIRIFDEGPTNPDSDDILLATAGGSTFRTSEESFVFCWDKAHTHWMLFHSTAGRAIGMQTISIPADAMTARATAGAEDGTVETSAAKINISTLNFDQTTDKFAQFHISFPRSWNAGTVYARYRWTAASSTGVVAWKTQALSMADNAALDASFGTAIEVLDTLQTVDRMHVSPWSAAITVASAAADCETYFQVFRDTGANDTLDTTAKLIGVELLYESTAGNDD